jgi:peroxiredoxin
MPPDAGGHDAVVGESAPTFTAAASTGKTLALDDFVGKVPVALTFAGTLAERDVDALITGFNDVFAEFGRHHIQVLIVTAEHPNTVRRRRKQGTNVPLLADEDGQLLERYAASATFPATVFIDESATITQLIEGGTPDEHVAAVRAHARRANTEVAHEARADS